MIINADWKGLEWLGVVYLSKDETGYEEIRNQVDQHKENQDRFGLPTRLIAKTFVFRLIYGGSAWSYAHDADFTDVSNKQEYWQDVIDKFYLKYWGIKRWHDWLMQEVMKSGKVILPTGRQFTFIPSMRKGQWEWPRTTILNYPVQGFSADLMVLARVLLARKLASNSNLICRTKLVCTVHDSIVLDAPDEEVSHVAKLIFETWKEIPQMFEKYFKMPFDLPCTVEVSYGPDWKNQKEIKDERCNI